MRVLIEPTINAVTSSLHVAADKFASVAQDGLTGLEQIELKISMNGTYQSIRPLTALTAKNNYLQIAGPNSYEVVKPATTNAVGVYVEF